jgi:putative transposase
MAESMFAIFKTELFRKPAVVKDYGGHWKGLEDLEIATRAWILWFKEERIHGELNDQTPTEIEADDIVKPQANAA